MYRRSSFQFPWRVLGIGAATTLLLLIGAFGYFAFTKSQGLVSHIEDRLGVQFHIADKELGLNSLDLKGVTISGRITGSVDRIKVESSLRGFSSSAVSMTNVSLKVPLSEAKRFFSIEHSAAAREPLTEILPFASIPKNISLRSVVIEVVDQEKIFRLLIPEIQYANGIARANVAQVVHNHRLIADDLRVEQHFATGQINGRIEANTFRLRTELNTSEHRAKLSYHADQSPEIILEYLAQFGVKMLDPVRANLELTKNDNKLSYKASLMTPGSSFEHPFLAEQLVRLPPLDLEFSGYYDLSKSKLYGKKGKAKLGKGSNQAKVGFGFIYDARPEALGDLLYGYVKTKSRCANILSNLPSGLSPSIGKFVTSGSLDLNLHYSLNTSSPDKFKYRVKRKKFDCTFETDDTQLTSANLEKSRYLISSFQKRSPYRSPYSRTAFTHLSELKPQTIKTFLASEDGNFYRHDGIDFSNVERALRQNLERRQIVSGASTITMQTAKNLFLTPKKTLGRKLEEIFIARYLEQNLTKDRILEMYLNMIEFGPGIYGIANASQHFFSKGAQDLTLLESTYLASLLPAPVPRYRHFCKGQVSSRLRAVVDYKLGQMRDLAIISTEQHDSAIAMPIKFTKYVPAPAYCQPHLSANTNKARSHL